MTPPCTGAAGLARSFLPLCLAAGLLTPWALTASAAAATELQKAEARYKADRAFCIGQRSNQGRETCLREAGAALAEASAAAARPRPPQPTPDYAANALARCDRVPERDRADCRRMVQGQGTHQGSVAGGAIMYELVTRTVDPAASAASAP